MKKLSYISMLAMAAMAAFSCNKETEDPSAIPADLHSVVVKAYADNDDDTKTSLSGKSIVWSEDDVVSAFALADATYTKYDSRSVALSNDGKTAEFEFEVSGDIEYVAYPASENMTMTTAGTFNGVVIPTSQPAVENGFAPRSNAALAKYENGVAKFKNIGGLLGIKFTSESDVIAIKLSVADGQNIAGTANVAFSVDGETVTATPTFTAGSSSVTLTATTDAPMTSGKTYYFCVAPGTYSGLTIQFTNTDGETATFTNSNALTVARNAKFSIGNITILDTKWVSPTLEDGYYVVVAETVDGAKQMEASTTTTQGAAAFTATPNGDGKYAVNKEAIWYVEYDQAEECYYMKSFASGNYLYHTTSTNLEAKNKTDKSAIIFSFTVDGKITTSFREDPTRGILSNGSNFRAFVINNVNESPNLYFNKLSFYPAYLTPEFRLASSAINASPSAGQYTVENFYEIFEGDDSDVTITTDGTVVTAASINGGTLTYTVTGSSSSGRAGSISFAFNGDTYVVDVLQISATASVWDLITSADEISVDDVVIIAASGYNWAMGGQAGSGNNMVAADITKSDSKAFVDNDDVVSFTVKAGSESGSWAFFDGSKYLTAASSSSNYLKLSEGIDDDASWDISISNNEAAIVSIGDYTRNTMRFNGSATQGFFACYASGQNPVSLYRLASAAMPVVSISLSGQTTDFYVADEFAFGGTVTATFEDGSTSDVTSAVTFSGYNMAQSGEQTVTVSFTKAGKTVTATYTITVTERELLSITLGGSYPTTFYTADSFSHEGMTVTATYSGPQEKVITNGLTFSGYDMSNPGEQTVTVSYTESGVTKTATYTITVIKKIPTNIELSGTYPTTFYVGSAFDRGAMVVTATYNDSKTANVTKNAVFSGFDSASVAEGQTITVSYTYNGETVSTTYNVDIIVEPTEYVIDFERALTAYTDWTFFNILSQQTGQIDAHGGSNYGLTNGTETASITTKNKVTAQSIKFYVSKVTTNSNTSTWKVQVSSNKSSWTDVQSVSASSMSKGEWIEVTADLSSHSDVYVSIYYTGSTAKRAIDDVTLNCAPPVAVTGVSLNKTATTLAVGETETLAATIAPDNATNKNVTWSSDDTSVATVENGVVTAVAAGTANITVTTAEGEFTATCAVTVNSVAVTGVTLNKTETTLAIGATETLTPIFTPTTATNKNVTWSSSNTSVATVANGVVTAVAAGTATITVTTEDGNKTATCSVIVTAAQGGGTLKYSLTINTSNFNSTSYAANNNSKTSVATCTTDNSKTKEISWTSNQIMLQSSVMQWQKNAGYLYNTTDLGTIISVTVNKTEGSFTTYYGTTEHPTSGSTVGNGYFTVKVGGATGKTSSVVVVFEQ